MSAQYSAQRIGFSGTDAIHLPEFKDNNWTEIVPDTEGEEKIKNAILGWGKGDKIFSYTIESMWDKLKDYDVLIDADALLREEGSSLDIVKRWSEDVKDNYLFVYLDSKHNPLVYDPENPDTNTYYKYDINKKYKHYFDQKHTVGIDLKLHPKAKALTLISNDSKLVDVAQAIYRLRQIGKEGQTTDFMIDSKNIISSRPELYKLLKTNDNKFKEDLLPEHFIQNAKTVERLAYNNLEKYKEDVKYYDRDIIKYEYKDKLAKEIFDEGKDLDRGDNPLIELQIEQEKEQEQEQEQEQEFINPINFDCNNVPTNLMEDQDYLDVSNGKILNKTKILISSYVPIPYDIHSINRYSDYEYCFIELENGYYKIITIRESLLLKGRNIINPKYYYRYDPVDENTTGLFLLAQGFCNRHLHLHEQLKIIKEVTEKEDIYRIASCYYVLRYEIMLDYLNSKLLSEEYLKNFIKVYSYHEFLSRWLNLKIGNKFTKDYYNKCISIIKS